MSVFALWCSSNQAVRSLVLKRWLNVLQAFDRLLGDGACQKQCADAGLPIDLEWLNSTATTNEVGGCSQPAASVRLC